MKALSVRQPWAWLLFHGKPVENRVTMAQARTLLRSLESAVKAVDRHFACPFKWQWLMNTEISCGSRGSVKVNGKWWCKKHAKKAEAQSPAPVTHDASVEQKTGERLNP